MEDNSMLLHVLFETGEPDCPYWTVSAIIKNGFDSDALEEQFESYLKDADEDLEFEDIVADVLDAMGWLWEFVKENIPACGGQYFMYM